MSLTQTFPSFQQTWT